MRGRSGWRGEVGERVGALSAFSKEHMEAEVAVMVLVKTVFPLVP
jgi:hypothetical protein